jgi:hypothetical protein
MMAPVHCFRDMGQRKADFTNAFVVHGLSVGAIV